MSDDHASDQESPAQSEAATGQPASTNAESGEPVAGQEPSTAQPQPGAATPRDGATAEERQTAQPRGARVPALWLLAAGAIVASVVFAYWPCLLELVDAWERHADYSHGYLVVPVALLLLWLRREKFPGFTGQLYWAGLAILLLSIGVRVFGALLFLTPVDGWSIVVWAIGAVWFLFGPRVLWWALPSILFLLFMVPLPFRAETWLSVPLQRAASQISCWTLQLLGQPAIVSGNVIQIGEHQMFVEEACSGLRIFVAIVALAYVYLVLVKRSWWERGLLVLAILPVALAANVTRIVVTSLLYRYTTGDFAHRFSHDWAGFAMIPFAAAMFGLVLWYIGALFREVEQVHVGVTFRQRQSES